MVAPVIHDVRLPTEIEVGAQGGPAFLTQITSISSGAEQNNQAWEQQRLIWNVSYGIQTAKDYADALSFFYERRGRAFGFRFCDWSDGSVITPALDQNIGTGDGVQRVFHLAKVYGAGQSWAFTRYITHPVWDTITVKVGGLPNTAWAQGANGTLVWPPGSEPVGAITWSGQFDVPVRFDTDQFVITLEALASGTIGALYIVEQRVDPNVPPIDVAFANAVTSVPEHTSAKTFLADLVAIDDGLGTNAFTLSGTNAANFEIDATLKKLYLRAGVSPLFENGNLTCTVGVHDTSIGANPAATRVFNLTITNVVELPTISFTSPVHNVAVGTSTASHVLLAGITVVSDVAATTGLTGADAASFEIVSGSLYLKAGVDTSVARHLAVNVTATNTTGTTTVPFLFTIGMVAGEQVFDTVGDFTFTVPIYNTLEISVESPGAGAWGYSVGSTSGPTAATETYCQNDQTFTALQRWRVKPFVPQNNPDAFTPSTLVATVVMNSFGIGPALSAYNGGNFGGLGYFPDTSPYPGHNLPSGKGGDSLYYDGLTAAGGASVTVTTPNTAGVISTASANGNNGAVPGAGGSGGVFKSTNNIVTFSITGQATNQTTDCGLAGGASGMFAQKVWTWGSAQVGAGSDYTASAPAINETLYIRIGAGGVGGLGTVAGGNGGHGRVRIKWS